MDHSFPTNDFSLLESCHLYVIAKYKTSNCCKIEALIQRYLAKLVGELLCQRLFKIKLQLKKILWHRRFPVNTAKFLRTPFYRTPPVTASVKIRTKSLKSAKFQFQLFLTTSINHAISTIQSVLQSGTTYFSSSDWSIFDFLLTEVTNLLQLASKMYAS